MPSPTANSFTAASPGPRPATSTAELTSGFPSAAKSPEADAEIGEDAIQALREDEGDDDDVAEQASWCVPAPIQAVPSECLWLVTFSRQCGDLFTLWRVTQLLATAFIKIDAQRDSVEIAGWRIADFQTAGSDYRISRQTGGNAS